METLQADVALRLAGEEPDYHVKDMFHAIESRNYPTWILYVQVMRPEDVAESPVDIFDCTFTWPHEKYQLRPVGRMRLYQNVRALTLRAQVMADPK